MALIRTYNPLTKRYESDVKAPTTNDTKNRVDILEQDVKWLIQQVILLKEATLSK